MPDVDEYKREREREHPVRRRILEIYERDEDRSPTPKELEREMSDMEEPPSLSQVNYHLRRLQRVGLVPES